MIVDDFYDDMKTKYLAKVRDFSIRCSQLYAKYSHQYHSFVLVRDMHVRMSGGGNRYPVGSTFCESEVEMYFAALAAGRSYVKYAVSNFDFDLLVGCNGHDLKHMTRDRIYNEMISEIHPDLSNFVRVIERRGLSYPSICDVDFSEEIFFNEEDSKPYRERMQSLFLWYYPKYSVRPMRAGCVSSQNTEFGLLEGSLVMSHAEHVCRVYEALLRVLGVRDPARLIVEYVFTDFTWI